MTDIYVGKRNHHRLPVILGIAFTVVAILGMLMLTRSGKEDTADVEASEQAPQLVEVDEIEEPAAAPAAAPEPTPQVSQNTDHPDQGPRLISRAREHHEKGELMEARMLCLEIISTSTNEAAIAAAENLLGEINVRLVMNPFAMPEKIDYTVQSGDSLARLAKRYNTTVELLQAGNNLRGSNIRVGDRLRIFTGTFSVDVDKSDNILILNLNDQFFKRYHVGTGKYNKTPVGEFEITDRIPQPTWWRPDGKAIPFGDTNNVLGTHWLSLNVQGYGLHGTWEPETIGKQESAGCVRLLNREIEELYTLLPSGTAVTITD